MFFSFFENGISLKTQRNYNNNSVLSSVDSEPMKNLNKSIFQMKYSQKFMAELVQSYGFKNFLKDYHKIDLNSTTRFKNILNKIVFENSKENY